jgi:hypothetical protein
MILRSLVMGAMTPAEILQEETSQLPEHLQLEVIDFVGYLRMKHNIPSADDWDKQMEQDAESGALDAAFAGLADAALAEHRAGKTKPL